MCHSLAATLPPPTSHPSLLCTCHGQTRLVQSQLRVQEHHTWGSTGPGPVLHSLPLAILASPLSHCFKSPRLGWAPGSLEALSEVGWPALPTVLIQEDKVCRIRTPNKHPTDATAAGQGPRLIYSLQPAAGSLVSLWPCLLPSGGRGHICPHPSPL